jgi:hypothetical protein
VGVVKALQWNELVISFYTQGGVGASAMNGGAIDSERNNISLASKKINNEGCRDLNSIGVFSL